MNRAYAETYLEDVMDNLAVMLDFAVNTCAYPIAEFYSWFLHSGVSDLIAEGRIRYLTGLSGIELADSVASRIGVLLPEHDEYCPESCSPEYWCGWALAYVQWYTGKSFRYLDRYGVNALLMLSLYDPLHEADLSKLLDVILHRLETARNDAESPVSIFRKQAGMTQVQLAERAGVSLRMIRAYEQKAQDISKAEAATVLNLSRALRCDAADLVG